ncbi:response regulator transcription factor [Methylobacterium sp. E-016]|jgi:DNA-binding NarL/FixJ family response regulator|uniref:response regulator transcription factor n=1 Tax=Methylobacterium sp. E-016 TaxID=2836556 RepID=UPI001FB9B5BA|nr:response regulator transcription factor [Methylobacterium sp. E-016]MCJ2077303.1 response regulator transcription factor [Methylobacterium sp. E-016]
MPYDTRPIRITLIDDHPLFRRGVRSLLEHEPDIEVVAESENGVAGLRILGDKRPDLVILDVSMPDLNGIAVARQMRRLDLDTRVLMLSMSEERSTVQQALAAGAMGYVLKRSASDNLIHAVRAVHRGGLYIDPVIAERHLLPSITVAPLRENEHAPNGLSEREREVVRLVAFGFTSKEISVKLGISSKSVEKFKARACEKLEIRSRAAMVRYAVIQDWLRDPLE